MAALEMNFYFSSSNEQIISAFILYKITNAKRSEDSFMCSRKEF